MENLLIIAALAVVIAVSASNCLEIPHRFAQALFQAKSKAVVFQTAGAGSTAGSGPSKDNNAVKGIEDLIAQNIIPSFLKTILDKERQQPGIIKRIFARNLAENKDSVQCTAHVSIWIEQLLNLNLTAATWPLQSKQDFSQVQVCRI